MSFELADIHDTGIHVYHLHFGTDGKLWCSTLGQDSVISVDPKSGKVQKHFSDDGFCTFHFDRDFGAVGTNDGRLFVFSLGALSLRHLAQSNSPMAIGPIEIDHHSNSVFYGCGGMIYRVSFAGAVLGKLRCSIACGAMRFLPSAQRLWSACDGIEVFDLSTGQSLVKGQGRLCPYSDIALAPNGNIACFGGDIDIFTPEGRRLGCVSGDYNRGLFTSCGRLIANRVTHDIPTDVSISTDVASGIEIEFVTMCDSHALDQTGNTLVASHRGKLFVFRKQ